jgi:pimeloyl-ACP methyl ester carboxylesterase
MQEQGYAVLVLDLRGHGANPRQTNLSAQDWRLMIGDLQNAYSFLVDRHNRGELNLARLAVVALGDGANLAAAWAASPGGGVSNEGRLSDIGALVLLSPVAEAPGLSLARILPSIATRFPLFALCGDRDQTSIQAVRDNQRVIERHRLSRVGYLDTSLHGGRLLAFFPKVAPGVERFLDDPVKNRRVDWEPRYLLEPVAYDGVVLVADSGFGPVDQAQARAAQDAKEAPKGPAAKGEAKNR